MTRAGRFLLDPSLNTRNGEISRNIEKALAHATRKAINEVLARDHPEIFARIEPTVWQKPWVAYARACTMGRGRTALRYLAAYVKKSSFSEGRLLDYDQSGRIPLSYRDSADGKLRSEALDSLELIRRWLLDSFAPAQSGLRPCTACGLSRWPPGGSARRAFGDRPLLPQNRCLPPQKAQKASAPA